VHLIFCPCDFFLTLYLKLKHVTIGLFEENGITIINFDGQLHTLFEEYKLTNKIIYYVEDESTNMSIMTNLLKQIVSYEKLKILAPFKNVCFGHALSKACQYAIFDENVSLGLQPMDLKSVYFLIKTCITWSKKFGYRRVKWTKACLVTNLWPLKLNT
jgi:hypothetical protein